MIFNKLHLEMEYYEPYFAKHPINPLLRNDITFDKKYNNFAYKHGSKIIVGEGTNPYSFFIELNNLAFDIVDSLILLAIGGSFKVANNEAKISNDRKNIINIDDIDFIKFRIKSMDIYLKCIESCSNRCFIKNKKYLANFIKDNETDYLNVILYDECDDKYRSIIRINSSIDKKINFHTKDGTYTFIIDSEEDDDIEIDDELIIDSEENDDVKIDNSLEENDDIEIDNGSEENNDSEIINKKENDNMEIKNLFEGLNLEFGKVEDDSVRVSHLGLAIKNRDGKYVTYSNGNLVDTSVIDLQFLRKALFKVPVATNALSIGDVILHNKKYLIITDISNGIEVVDSFEGEFKKILPTFNLFGFNYYTKVISLIDLKSLGKNANPDNPFGNIMPMMLMSSLVSDKSNDNKDMMEMIMISQMIGNNENMNNILPLLMMSNNSDNKDMMEMIMISQLFKGGNPFESITEIFGKYESSIQKNNEEI